MASEEDEDLWKWNRWQLGFATLVLAISGFLGIFSVALSDYPWWRKLIGMPGLLLFGVVNAKLTRWLFRGRRQ